MDSPMIKESESTLDKPFINKDEFNSWLMNKISRQSTMVSRAYGERIIQYLRDLREKGADNPEMRSKYGSAFRFQVKKRKFQLINVVGLGDILCLPIKDKTKASHAMLGQHRQVIFKEDMFDVIDNAHKNGERHRGYKGTFKKINATYCNIPREVVHKYVNMCQFCQKAHACFVPTTLRGTSNKIKRRVEKIQPRKREIEMAFLTRCQIDVLDMQNFPDTDGKFSYIGHFLDHHTKYNVLFPLKRTDAFYVARKLCRYVFGHFGLPHILHSNLGRNFIDELITWILQFWSTDAQIVNGNPRLKKMSRIVQQRQKTIMILIETIRAKQAEATSWAVWLPGIQYSLNTNQFEAENPPAFDIVFNRRPKVYTYAPSSKSIPREEDILVDDGEDDNQMNQVITVSVSDLIQQGTDSLLISQLNPDGGGELEPNSDESNEKTLKQGGVLSTDLLNASSLTTIPMSLAEQYTIIGVDSNTIQIPVVNLGTNTISMNSNFTGSVIKPDMLRNSNDNVTSGLELSNQNLGLSNENMDNLGLSSQSSLELGNETVSSELRLSNLDMDDESRGENSKCGQDDKTNSKDEMSVFSIKHMPGDSMNSLEDEIHVSVDTNDSY